MSQIKLFSYQEYFTILLLKMEEFQHIAKKWCTSVETSHNRNELQRIKLECEEKKIIPRRAQIEKTRQLLGIENRNDEQFEKMERNFEQDCEQLKQLRVEVDQNCNILQQHMVFVERYKTICEQCQTDSELFIQLQKFQNDLIQLHSNIKQSNDSNDSDDSDDSMIRQLKNMCNSGPMTSGGAH